MHGAVIIAPPPGPARYRRQCRTLYVLCGNNRSTSWAFSVLAQCRTLYLVRRADCQCVHSAAMIAPPPGRSRYRQQCRTLYVVRRADCHCVHALAAATRRKKAGEIEESLNFSGSFIQNPFLTKRNVYSAFTISVAIRFSSRAFSRLPVKVTWTLSPSSASQVTPSPRLNK